MNNIITNQPILRDVTLAACVALTTLLFLFIIYDGRRNLELPPSPVKIGIGMVPQMATVLIWRNYIYNRLHWDDDPHGKEHNRAVMSLFYPYWYKISCAIMFLGNCMLPMQFLFSSNLLDPQTGDPYQFNVICAICYGFVFTMIGLNILLDVAIFIAKKVVEWTRVSQQLHIICLTRRFHRFRSPLTFLLSAKIVLGGALIATEDPVVVKITVPISKLSESLDGFRIIQLSDLHIGVTVGRTKVKKVVDIVNDLCIGSDDACGLIALTGDIIDGEPYGLTKAIEPLAELSFGENVPKVFVTGNHEHLHFKVDHVLTTMSDMGIVSLMNDNIRLPRGKGREEQLVLVGLEDLSRRSQRKEQQAFDGVDSENSPIILLAHQPNHLRLAERRGVDLMLSGHTHCGQFFPGTIGAWLFNSRFSGYYPRRRKTAVYVSAGTLWWGPPVRFTTRHHEITDIRLVRSR
jgi:predicted MPP superfamily phosphohydrolase